MLKGWLAKIVLAASLIINAVFGWNFYSQNIVTQVVDGDTLQLQSGKRVKLMDVDVPEYDHCGGQEAKQRLTELILNKHVSVKEEVSEAYGRSLGLVYQGSTLINEVMLSEGWGRQDYRKNSQRDRLTQAFHQAQQQKIGIFSELCRKEGEAETDCNIKGNIDPATYQKTYHLPGCKHYNQTIIDLSRGEKFFCDEPQASAAGFTKAAGCE